MDYPIIRRTIIDGVSAGRDNLPGKFVPGFVTRHALVDPVVIAPHLVVGKVIARDQQKI